MRRVLAWLTFFTALVALGSGLGSILAHADTLPVSGPMPGQTGFSTMDGAAVAVEQQITRTNPTSEQAGAIYELAGKFYFTAPASNDGGDYFHVAVQFPAGARFVALYHDHPYGPTNDLFSAPDVQVANQLHVTSYIGVIADVAGRSHVLKYIPGSTPTKRWTNGIEGTLESSGVVSKGQFLEFLK